MIPPEFEYVRPGSLDEAVSALADAGEDGKPLAGGQSLMPLLRMRLAYPEVLIDLDRVPELREIRDLGDALFVGAMATHHQVVNDPLVQRHVPLLAQATATVADPAVRHRGTFGGALAHADPAGDLPAVAVALDAVCNVRSARGSRDIPAADFFVDWMTSALEPDELLVGVTVPKLGPGWSTHYEKFHRTAQAWAVVGVACAVRRERDTVTDCRVALTNMGHAPVRATAVEHGLAGGPLTDATARQAAEHAAEGTSPPGDLHGSAEYRAHLARVLTRRALLATART
ncbi:FAD binding domain-containing protein [Thermomonospora cellulosilytica]|uniref:Carbon-monoxide dehydrogenase medium subunit n=1 Tax=Thermomonospora cellulosilytica TaxID=1411118 RepID=A0A7W3R682_9ACTN|nr:xanthine dehydrogenase family protein subunit M [Thermomonospora cellulosilytica]MBA9001214.1 carbon-monoxide dehydrogenase medium subunit [Thermomonospora cellulosilytica]